MKKIYLVVKVDHEKNRNKIYGAYQDYAKASKVTMALQDASNEHFEYYVHTLTILD